MPHPLDTDREVRLYREELAAVRQQLEQLMKCQEEVHTAVNSIRIAMLPSRPASRLLPEDDPKVTTPPLSGEEETAFRREATAALAAQEDMQKQRLKELFILTEKEEEKEEAQHVVPRAGLSRDQVWRKLRSADKHTLELLIDSVMGGVIVTNAIFIGISLDQAGDRGPGWYVIDFLFSAFFWTELLLKVTLHGFRGQFCGASRLANLFDAALIIVDTMQLLIGLFMKDVARSMNDSGAPAASLFRVVRLMRLARVLRLMRSERVKDLLSMIHGLVNGISTLGWAILLLGLIVYVGALVCVELFGRTLEPGIGDYFSNVPRSMFTVFRCSFGDCSTDGGTPIIEHVAETYGWLYALGCCLYTFFVTIGLFNIISAIFVDSTMAAAAEAHNLNLQMRLESQTRLATNMTLFIKRVLHYAAEEIPNNKLSANLNHITSIEVPRAVIDEVVRDEYAIYALNELDIDPHDHAKLNDILDPDNNGHIGILELTNGLISLRGQPRRSDIVMVDLMLRSIQSKLLEIFTKA